MATNNGSEDVEVGRSTVEAVEEGEVSNTGCTLETNWTIPATSRFLDLIEERKRRILETGSSESTNKLRYEDWHPISKKLQSEGFMYSGASCQRKYCNMKKSYINNKKIVENRRKMAEKSKKPLGGPIQIIWPFFFRFGAFFEEKEQDPDVVILIRGKGTSKPKSSRDDESSDEDESDDEEEEEEFSRTRPKKRQVRVKTKFNFQVSNAIHTLLTSEPVIILDDGTTANEETQADPDYAPEHEADPELSGAARIKEEPYDETDDGVDDSALLQRLKRRKLQVVIPRLSEDEYHPQLPAKRVRKSRVRYSPDSERSRSHSPERDSRPILTPTPKVKTFSLRSTVSDEALTEIRYLRGDVARVNRNLEDLVTSHNQLIDNFEKLFKFMVKRFK